MARFTKRYEEVKAESSQPEWSDFIATWLEIADAIRDPAKDPRKVLQQKMEAYADHCTAQRQADAEEDAFELARLRASLTAERTKREAAEREFQDLLIQDRAALLMVRRHVTSISGNRIIDERLTAIDAALRGKGE